MGRAGRQIQGRGPEHLRLELLRERGVSCAEAAYGLIDDRDGVGETVGDRVGVTEVARDQRTFARVGGQLKGLTQMSEPGLVSGEELGEAQLTQDVHGALAVNVL